MRRCCSSVTVRMASSTSSTGAATAISGGSIRRSRREAAALVPPHRGASADEQHGAGGAGLTDIAERRLYDVLVERELLGSTGIGRGIAIPHGKLTELSRLCGLFARLERPIPFDAIDDQPVDLVFVLLAPAGAGADHLRALARVSRLLRDGSICQKLRGTDNADALYALLTDHTESHAA